MKPNVETLSYLRHDLLAGFSADMFGSAMRLPVLGAILELTPNIETDRFYSRQITSLLDSDPANTHREIQRAMKNGMVAREQAGSNIKVILGRLATPRWDIIDIALNVAKKEFEL